MKKKLVRTRILARAKSNPTPLPVGQCFALRRMKQENQALFPKENLRDLDDLPDEVKPDLNFHAVETIDEVIKLVFEQSKKSTAMKAAKTTNITKPAAEIASKHE